MSKLKIKTYKVTDSDFPTPPESVTGAVACVKTETKTLFVTECTGGHIIRAQKLAKANPERYYPALMHVLVRDENGRQLPMEDYSDMSGKVYSKLMMIINDQLIDDEDEAGEE